jgi:hypothetical protein
MIKFGRHLVVLLMISATPMNWIRRFCASEQALARAVSALPIASIRILIFLL